MIYLTDEQMNLYRSFATSRLKDMVADSRETMTIERDGEKLTLSYGISNITVGEPLVSVDAKFVMEQPRLR